MSYYEDLGVPINAAPADIKRAYRRLAHKHHPDRNGGSTEAFQKIQRAYDLLSDPERRKKYDDTGQDTEGPTIRQKAHQQVAALMYEAVNHVDVIHVDLIKEMKGKIREAIAKTPEMVGNINRDIARFEAAASRVKRKQKDDKPNMLSAMLAAQVEAAKANLKSIEDQGKVCEEMLAVLDEYRYLHESIGLGSSATAPGGIGNIFRNFP